MGPQDFLTFIRNAEDGVQERGWFEDRGLMAATSGYGKIKFQADNPDETSAKEVMQRFGTVGLPTYAVVKPRP